MLPFAKTTQGQELLRSLNIDPSSLGALNPGDAIKLSLGIVGGLSKYSMDQMTQGETWASSMTAMDLLSMGMQHIDDPEWGGNGVCCNIACDVKAVFEALKLYQGPDSMLRNTYAVYIGTGPAGFRLTRADPNLLRINDDGHAWVNFITIDSRGSAAYTTADATWSLSRQPMDRVRGADYTMERMSATVRQLLERSTDKVMALHELADYYRQLAVRRPGERPDVAKQRWPFVMTEFLEAVRKVLPDMEDSDIPFAPYQVLSAAYEVAADLDHAELNTLYRISRATGWTDFDSVLARYVKNKCDEGNNAIQRLLFGDDDLQRRVYEHLTPDMMDKCIKINHSFRARLRMLRDDLLPPLDPSSWDGSKEVEELIRLNKAQGVLPKFYGKHVRKILHDISVSDAVYDAFVTGKTDEDLLIHFAKYKAVLNGSDTTQGGDQPHAGL